MKSLLIILLLFKLTIGHSQTGSQIILSDDGNYLLLFKERLPDFTSSFFLELYNTDSLYDYINQFIFKEDTIFALQRSFPGQRGYYYYENDRKSYNVVYDTLMLEDLCSKYKMDPKNLIFSKSLQFGLDTIRYNKSISRVAAFYCNDILKESDTTIAIKFIYHFSFNNIEIQKNTIELAEDYILNSVENEFAHIYVDEIRQVYFMNAVINTGGCGVSEDTYEIYTIFIPMQLKKFGKVFW